jgi:hypothetical protein
MRRERPCRVFCARSVRLFFFWVPSLTRLGPSQWLPPEASTGEKIRPKNHPLHQSMGQQIAVKAFRLRLHSSSIPAHHAPSSSIALEDQQACTTQFFLAFYTVAGESESWRTHCRCRQAFLGESGLVFEDFLVGCWDLRGFTRVLHVNAGTMYLCGL